MRGQERATACWESRTCTLGPRETQVAGREDSRDHEEPL